MRLNVGAGSRTLEGWFNIDVEQNPDATRPLDLLCDFKSIPLPDMCASEVMAIHVAEHAYRWEIDAVLAEWYRLLRPGGKLVLELPNLVKCCQNYLDGKMRGGKHPDQLARFGIYGDPRLKNKWMTHPWGYSPEEMIGLVQAAGFIKAKEHVTQHHPCGRAHRDMRIEAYKP